MSVKRQYIMANKAFTNDTNETCFLNNLIERTHTYRISNLLLLHCHIIIFISV